MNQSLKVSSGASLEWVGQMRAEQFFCPFARTRVIYACFFTYEGTSDLKSLLLPKLKKFHPGSLDVINTHLYFLCGCVRHTEHAQ